MNELGYNHTTEYYAAVKKDEAVLYELIWSNFQDMSLSEKKHKRSSVVSSLLGKRKRNKEKICLFLQR